MKNDELKPCPFCGKRPCTVKESDGMRKAYCNNDDCRIYEIRFYFGDWNTRTEPKEQDVCPDCNGSGFFDIFFDGIMNDENVCKTCKGTGKFPVDKVREAFEGAIKANVKLGHSEAKMYMNYIDDIYKPQQAEIERLKAESIDRQNSMIKAYKDLQDENEAMQCCGNCLHNESNPPGKLCKECSYRVPRAENEYWVLNVPYILHKS